MGKELSESSVREKSQISAALFNFRGCLSFKIWGDIFYGRAVMHLSFFGHPVAGRGGGGRSCVNITLHGEFNRGGFERLPRDGGNEGGLVYRILAELGRFYRARTVLKIP